MAHAAPAIAQAMRKSSQSQAHVYLLRCSDGSLYCGWAADLDARLVRHNEGKASRYTRSRLPVELAWSKPVASRSEALREEARIKRLPRAAKLRLLG
jgi:putative endonuclease